MASNLLLKIYPSGFLGSSSVEQTDPISLVANIRNIINKQEINKTIPYTANEKVSELWSDYTANNSNIDTKSFEFREMILVQALSAFGTNTFKQWVDAQIDNEHSGDNHYRWIDETLLFVLAGKPRLFQHNTWQVVLSADKAETKVRTYTKTMNQFLVKNELYKRLTMKSFITEWVRRPGGIDDLLISLHVCFGKR